MDQVIQSDRVVTSRFGTLGYAETANFVELHAECYVEPLCVDGEIQWVPKKCGRLPVNTEVIFIVEDTLPLKWCKRNAYDAFMQENQRRLKDKTWW